MGPWAGLDGCRKTRPRRDSISGPPSPYRVTIPTDLSRPTLVHVPFAILHGNYTFNTFLRGLLERKTYCRTRDFVGSAYDIRTVLSSIRSRRSKSSHLPQTKHQQRSERQILRASEPTLCCGCPLLTSTPMFTPSMG